MSKGIKSTAKSNQVANRYTTKDNTHSSQIKIIHQYLYTNSATASMVCEATGVAQKCITRYKRELEKAGLLWELYKTNCETTGFKAWYLTTDPEKKPKGLTQLTFKF